jgi:rod shape-determining protein MreC
MATYQENFFTRGPSPLARVTFFSILAIAVMIADHRFQALDVVRIGVTSVLTPIEQALAWPAKNLGSVSAYFSQQDKLIQDNKALTEQVLSLSAQGQRAALMAAEFEHVSALQAANNRFQRDGVIAEIIRDARNPFARKIILNRGLTHAISAGAIVIDGVGVVGQVTSLGASSSEVTLITEKDQSVPVMIVRNGARALAVGNGRDGTLELPFMPVATDVQVGDTLVTSGIDGLYPAGLAVGAVTVVDKNPAFSFARIVVQPSAASSHHRFVKVLLTPSADKQQGNPAAYPVADVGVDSSESGNDGAGKLSSKSDAKLDAKRAFRQKNEQKNE